MPLRLPVPNAPLPADAAAEAGAIPLGDLPDWDLTDLYASPDAPEIKRDLDWLETECAPSPPITRGNWPIFPPPIC
jgi:oligoendopeptidase F